MGPVLHVLVGDGLQEQQRVVPISGIDKAVDLIQQLPHLVHHVTDVPIGLRATHVVQRT